MGKVRLHGAIVLILLCSIPDATAQKRPSATMSLFGRAPVQDSGGEALGMRPESVGAVVRFPLSTSTAGNLRSRSNAPRRLQIALPGGQSVTCLLRPVARPGTMVVLGGTPAGGREGDRCNLVIDGGQVIGDIDLASGRYRIQPLGRGDVHAVVEVKTEAFPNEQEPQAALDEIRRDSSIAADTEQCDVKPAAGQPPKTFGPIRVMFVYTPAVRASTPNVRADIELIMQQLRAAYGARRLGGNFSVSVELAHAQEITYTEAGKMEQDLDRLSKGQDATFRPIHRLRDTHGADIVHLLINGNRRDGCGIGWLNLSLQPRYAFAVSDHQCALQVYSAVHEIGHNIGMAHDRFVEPEAKPGPAEHNFGFVSLQQRLRSLMAYNNQCAEQKRNCTRLLQLSSPNVRIGGQPFGRPINDPEAAYNVEVLCRNATAASRFR
jgi:hypothetical protein